MRARRRTGIAALVALGLLACASGALLWGPRAAWAKDPKEPRDPKGKPSTAKTGSYQLATPAPLKYVYLSVPKDYDASKWYPLAFVLHPMTGQPEANKPEPFVDMWAGELLRRGWILAGPCAPEYHNENTEGPLLTALRHVLSLYHIDERRVLLLGHNAGAQMAWHLAVKAPANFAAVLAFDAEVPEADRGNLKNFAGKSAYLFRGERDAYYTAAAIDKDRKYLELNKVNVTVFQKKDWGEDAPVQDTKQIADWMDKVYPPGNWKVAADDAQKALAAKDLPAASRAIAELRAELKKAPYSMFDKKAAELDAALLEAGRALIEDAKKRVDADPADAVAMMDAAVKSLKGLKPLEEEAGKALSALKKLPAVVEALKKKEAETAGSSYMEKATALEAKGDLAKALDAYRKAAALDWSKKADAEAKVAELEPKVGTK